MGYTIEKKDYGALVTKKDGTGEDAVVTNAWAFNDHVGISLTKGMSQGDTLILKAGWVELSIPIADLELIEEVPPVADDPVALMDSIAAVFVLD
jgi:hypothetical protein